MTKWKFQENKILTIFKNYDIIIIEKVEKAFSKKNNFKSHKVREKENTPITGVNKEYGRKPALQKEL